VRAGRSQRIRLNLFLSGQHGEHGGQLCAYPLSRGRLPWNVNSLIAADHSLDSATNDALDSKRVQANLKANPSHGVPVAVARATGLVLDDTTAARAQFDEICTAAEAPVRPNDPCFVPEVGARFSWSTLSAAAMRARWLRLTSALCRCVLDRPSSGSSHAREPPLASNRNV